MTPQGYKPPHRPPGRVLRPFRSCRYGAHVDMTTAFGLGSALLAGGYLLGRLRRSRPRVRAWVVVADRANAGWEILASARSRQGGEALCARLVDRLDAPVTLMRRDAWEAAMVALMAGDTFWRSVLPDSWQDDDWDARLTEWDMHPAGAEVHDFRLSSAEGDVAAIREAAARVDARLDALDAALAPVRNAVATPLFLDAVSAFAGVTRPPFPLSQTPGAKPPRRLPPARPPRRVRIVAPAGVLIA